jgi:hypothetical protein
VSDVFIQVIQAPCTRHDDLRAVAGTWRSELGAGASGWLGGTFGITDDDLFLGIVRFASREDAMANSARPEQAAWAERLAATLDGPPQFQDCDDVTVFLDGGSDDAGFVQVIQGTVSDRSIVRHLLDDTDELRRQRPEIIGGTFAVAEDGSFTQTVAFTDEASARAGEAVEPPPEMREAIGSLMAGARFHDLRQPWFESP